MARTTAFDEATTLRRARDLFWEYGYAGTSIQALEKATGLSRSSLYNTFGDKRAIYDRTLLAYQDENLTFLRQHLLHSPALRSGLESLFDQAIRLARGCYLVGLTSELAGSCDRARNFVVANRGEFLTIMEEALARAQAQGELRATGDVRKMANLLFLLYNGLQVMVKTGSPAEELKEAVRLGLSGMEWA